MDREWRNGSSEYLFVFVGNCSSPGNLCRRLLLLGGGGGD